MAITALQLKLTLPLTLVQNSVVKFDQTVFQSGDVTYDQISGEITLHTKGQYLINWWVSTTTSSALGVSFALSSSQSDMILGDSTAKTGQLGGFGIINITSPQTVKLINTQNATVPLSAYGGGAAGLAVTKYEEFSTQNTSACLAAAQWAYVLEQVTALYPETLITVFYDRLAASFSAYPYGVYISPYGDGAGFFVMYLGSEFVLLPLYQICAILIGDGAVYDDNIQYMPFPDPAAAGCDTDMLAAFYSYIPTGENVGIQISVNVNAQGDIYKNEFAILVMADEDKTSPVFFFTPKIQRVVTTVPPPSLLSKKGKTAIKTSNTVKTSGKVTITQTA